MTIMSIEAVFFDFGRTIYDSEAGSLFPETIKTLENLSQKGLKLGLLTVAETDDLDSRVKELDDLGLSGFFQSIDIVSRSTKGKDFTNLLRDFGMEEKAENCLVVGDNLKREITAGNTIGAFTVWTRQRLSDDWKPQNEIQTPKATIEAIEELIPLIEKINS